MEAGRDTIFFYPVGGETNYKISQDYVADAWVEVGSGSF